MTLERIISENRGIITAVLFGIVIVILLLLSSDFLRLVSYLAFTLVSGTIVYFLTLYRSPVDISPVFFLMIIIALNYGFVYSAAFVLAAGLFPAVLASFRGGEIGTSSFLFTGNYILLSFVSTLLSDLGIVYLGIVMAFINLIISWFIHYLKGDPGDIVFSIIHSGVTVFYFIAFGPFLIGTLG